MGIIVNEEYQDDRGVKITGCYCSFSRELRINKVNVKSKKEISAEQSDANSIRETSRTMDGSGNIVESIKYYITEDNYKYSVRGELVMYASKDIRKVSENVRYPSFSNLAREERQKLYSQGKQNLNRINVETDIEINELGNVFSKLYEKVKSDKTLFPYTNISDDL